MGVHRNGVPFCERASKNWNGLIRDVPVNHKKGCCHIVVSEDVEDPRCRFGYYDSDRLMYAGRTRNGFTPIVRQQVFKKFRGLAIKECPFANLPEAKSGRWGAALTAAKMKDCRWLKPVLVAQIEFLEWTGDNRLRHTKFVALRDDKPADQVRRE